MYTTTKADSPAILGLRSCDQMNLVARVMHMKQGDHSLFDEFEDCFGEIGTLPKTHHMTIDENIKPVIHAARRVPFALKDRLKSELDRMVNLDIIEAITEPTDWVSQLVVVEKPNGKLRVCLDPRDLNKAIKRQHYKLPTAEELFAEMAGAKYHRKDIISDNIQLKFFDPKLATKITCDASKTGLGATLKQQIKGVWQPIAFKSRSTTTAERNYCPLERETLAIVFGCSKFHDYLYGRQFTVESDHKPLKSIFNNPIHKAPARIQSFMLFLQKYDFHIEYIQGTSIEMLSTDTISRATPTVTLPTTSDNEISEADINAQVHQIISSLPITDKRLQTIRDETDKDETLQNVKHHVQNGWPASRKELKEHTKPFFNIRNELNTIEGLVLKGSRIVIPRSLIADIKKQLHVGHLGIQRTKDNARSCVYWPCIDADTTDMIESCSSCQHHRNRQQKETLIPHDIPPRAWSKVGTDLFTCLNHNYVVVVDYTSKYFDLHNLPDLKASTVIKKTKSIFARYGIPEEVFSDNGSQYSSRSYKDFAKQWNFTHTTSSPEFPQSNGLVERAIQTIKRTLIKCRETNSVPYLALLALRTTNNSTNTSPDQVL